MSPPAGLSTKTKVTRTRNATGDYRQQQCTNRERLQSITTQDFLQNVCLVCQMVRVYIDVWLNTVGLPAP